MPLDGIHEPLATEKLESSGSSKLGATMTGSSPSFAGDADCSASATDAISTNTVSKAVFIAACYRARCCLASNLREGGNATRGWGDAGTRRNQSLRISEW